MPLISIFIIIFFLELARSPGVISEEHECLEDLTNPIRLHLFHIIHYKAKPHANCYLDEVHFVHDHLKFFFYSVYIHDG